MQMQMLFNEAVVFNYLLGENVLNEWYSVRSGLIWPGSGYSFDAMKCGK